MAMATQASPHSLLDEQRIECGVLNYCRRQHAQARTCAICKSSWGEQGLVLEAFGMICGRFNVLGPSLVSPGEEVTEGMV